MINPDIKKAILAGVEARALYFGNTLVWLRKVDIVLDTKEVIVEVATDDTKHQFVAKTFTTSPAGYERNVSIKVGGVPYVNGMLLSIGNYTVTYTLADDPYYFGDTKSYNIVVRKEGEEPVTIPVSIVVNADPVIVQYAYDADYYDYTVKSFVTDPTGYEENVIVKVNNEVYTDGMRLTEGTYTVSYTLADGEGYTGDTKTYTLTVTKEAAPSPEPLPEGFDVDIANFDLYEPGNTNRLDPPGKEGEYHDWSWWNSISEFQTSMHTRECVTIENRSEVEGGTAVPSLCVYIKNESYTSSGKHFNAKTGFVYSDKMFPKGRIDIRANMMEDYNQKNSIWALSSEMQRSFTTIILNPDGTFTAGPKRTLKYLYEMDVVEYTPADPEQDMYGPNRAFWAWQQNKQSILHGATDTWARVEELKDSKGKSILTPEGKRQGWVDTFFANKGPEDYIDPLPWLFIDEVDGEPHCLSNGLWYAVGNTGDWYLSFFYNIVYDGNKFKGHYKTGGVTKCSYFIKSYVVEDAQKNPEVVRNRQLEGLSEGCYINTGDLHWIKYDPDTRKFSEGVGLEAGLDYFLSMPNFHEETGIDPHQIGLGKNEKGPIKGTEVRVGDWHTWGIELTQNRVRYLCDGYAYVDRGFENLHPLPPTEDYALGLIFATSYPPAKAAGGKLPVTDCMVINGIHFTPEALLDQEASQTEE